MTTTVFDRTDKSTHTNLTILSLNINGLSEEKKRTKLFEILIDKNIDIAILQETHSTKTINLWEKEWPGKSFWNSCKISKSSGIAIFLRKDLDIETHTILKDEEGRILSLNFSYEKQNFQIINIYDPTRNSMKPKFYKSLKQYITAKQNIILGGDFNMVEDVLMDRLGGNPNNTHMLGSNFVLAIKFCITKNTEINIKLKSLTNNIIQEKQKRKPDITNIENWQNSINDIENYAT